MYTEFIEFLMKYNNDLIEERLHTYEGSIVQAVYGLLLTKTSVSTICAVKSVTSVTEPQTAIAPTEIEETQSSALGGVEITSTEIKEILINCMNYKADFTSVASIGKRLRVLGITTKRVKSKETGKTKAIVVLEAQHLRKLFKKYLPESVMDDYNSFDSYVKWDEQE